MDPLEAAKIRAEEQPPKPGPNRPPKKPMELVRREEVSPPEPATVVAAEPSEPPPYVARRYRVLETRLFYWSGLPTTLSQGAIVTEDSYGKVGIESMQHQGIKLQELLPPGQ